jgi:hypothetical protein
MIISDVYHENEWLYTVGMINRQDNQNP